MKRIFSCLLAVGLVLSLAGCISQADRERKAMLDEYNGYTTVDYEMADGTTLDQQEIYDSDGVLVTALGIKSTEYGESELWLRVENNSDQEIHVEVNGIAVNGWQADGSAYFSVEHDSMERKCVSWGYYDEQLSPYGDTVGSVTLFGKVSNRDYETIGELNAELHTSAYEQMKDEILHSSYDTAGQVLYAKNDVEIIYQGFTDDFTTMRFYVRNGRKEPVILSSGDLLPALADIPGYRAHHGGDRTSDDGEYSEECSICSTVLCTTVYGGTKQLLGVNFEYYLPETYLVWDRDGWCWFEEYEEGEPEEYDSEGEDWVRLDQIPYQISSISIENGKNYRSIDEVSDVELTYHLEQPGLTWKEPDRKEEDVIAAVGEPEETPPTTGTEDAAVEAPPADEADSAAQEGTAQTEPSAESPAATETPPADEADSAAQEGTAQTEPSSESSAAAETPPADETEGTAQKKPSSEAPPQGESAEGDVRRA